MDWWLVNLYLAEVLNNRQKYCFEYSNNRVIIKYYFDSCGIHKKIWREWNFRLLLFNQIIDINFTLKVRTIQKIILFKVIITILIVTRFQPMFYFYTPSKHQKIGGYKSKNQTCRTETLVAENGFKAVSVVTTIYRDLCLKYWRHSYQLYSKTQKQLPEVFYTERCS